MPDEFIETTSSSWFSRIGNAIKGILFGIILLPVSIILLSWNEGRAVTTAKSLKEGAAAVVSVDAGSVLPANENKLIHLSGAVQAGGAVRDPIFGLTAEVLRIERILEMYQWKEKKTSESHKKLGGGEETVTKYTYDKVWSDKREDSSSFKHPQDHQNPASVPVSKGMTLSEKATLGAYKIPARMIAQMPGGEPLMPTQECLAMLSSDLKEKAKLNGECVYLGGDPAAPVIGDARVTFKVLKPGMFSFLAQQSADTLAPYPTKAGRSIERVESGVMSAELMFQHAETENRLITWGVRLGGFLLMVLGFVLVLNPLRVMGDVVPFIGDIVGIGTGLISGVMAFTVSLVVVAISWLAVRPILAGALLLMAVGALFYGTVRVRQSHARTASGATG